MSDTAFLNAIFAKNRALYGDLRMEGDPETDPAADPKPTDPAADPKPADPAADPKPTETVDYWKKRSRDNEKQAKANAEAAKKLAELEDAKKTEEQRRADTEAKQQQDHAALRTENLRLKAAGAYGVTGEDAEGVSYVDLISGTDEESVKASAEAIGRLVAAAQELGTIRAGNGGPPGGRPAPNLRAGATPPGDPAGPVVSGGITEAERRFGKKD